MVKKTTTIPMLIDIILTRIENLEENSKTLTLEEYSKDIIVQGFFERSLEVIGDACNEIIKRADNENLNIDEDVISEFKNAYSARVVITHGYDTIDNTIIFEIVKGDIFKLKEVILKMRGFSA